MIALLRVLALFVLLYGCVECILREKSACVHTTLLWMQVELRMKKACKYVVASQQQDLASRQQGTTMTFASWRVRWKYMHIHRCTFFRSFFSELCSKGGKVIKAQLFATSEPGDAREDCEVWVSPICARGAGNSLWFSKPAALCTQAARCVVALCCKPRNASFRRGFCGVPGSDL